MILSLNHSRDILAEPSTELHEIGSGCLAHHLISCKTKAAIGSPDPVAGRRWSILAWRTLIGSGTIGMIEDGFGAGYWRWRACGGVDCDFGAGADAHGMHAFFHTFLIGGLNKQAVR